MLAHIEFELMSSKDVASILSWTLPATGGPISLSNLTYILYPELKNLTINEKEESLNDKIMRLIQNRYNLYLMDYQKLPELYEKTWNKYNDSYMQAISDYLDIKWPTSITNIVAKVGPIPVCPRNIKDKSFAIHQKPMQEMVETCMHECCHFLFFEKCKEIFNHWQYRDFDYPSLLWYLSELVIDPILNHNTIQHIFPYQFKCYDSFYNVKIGSDKLIDKIRQIYDNYEIDNAIKLSYELLKTNEIMIREQCNDNTLREKSNYYICTNRTTDYKDEVEKILQTRKKEILDFFEVEDNGAFTFNIYIYDTQSQLVEGLAQRGFSKDPDYMCACHKDIDNSLNFFEPNDEVNDNNWSKEEYKQVIFHEEIHGIQKYIYGTQPEWLTEGVAKYLDGTYSKGIKYLLENYIDLNNLPSMYELEEEFGQHDYDSYDYAYLMVSYLIDTLGKKNFLSVMKDNQKLVELSDNLVQTSVAYYQNKVQLCNTTPSK